MNGKLHWITNSVALSFFFDMCILIQGPDTTTGEAEEEDDDDSVGTQEYDDLDGIQRAENITHSEDMEAMNRYTLNI